MDEQVRKNIIQELALTDATAEEVDEIITSLGGLIMELVLNRVTDTLDDSAVIIFEKILSAEDGQDKQDHLSLFFEEYVPNIEELIATASKDIIEDYKKLI